MLRGFPVLGPGAYVGTIDFTQPRKLRETLYLERLREGDTFLVILFREGFQPQTVFPERSSRRDQYHPIALRTSSGSLRLSGVEEESGIRGLVRAESNVVGSWTLRKMTAEEVATEALGEHASEVTAWMQAKERARISEQKLRELEENRKRIEERLEALEKSVADESLLRSRSEERRRELDAELTKIRNERDTAGKAVELLASELELLARITRRGQTVSLERRILQRENRWYDVNWQTEEELGLEDLPEAESGLDLEKLEQAVRRARETKSLLREREEELRKIRELENGGGRPAEPAQTPAQAEQGEEEEVTQPAPAPTAGKEDLWDRLFN